MTDPAIPGPAARIPATLRWAVWLLAAQAVVAWAITVLYVYEDFTAAAGSPGGAVASTLYFAMLAVVLVVLPWSLYRRRRWARGPAIVLELLMVPMGYLMITAGVPWLGVPVLVIGLVGAGLLLAPASREALGIR